jgi:hypothetical protein
MPESPDTPSLGRNPSAEGFCIARMPPISAVLSKTFADRGLRIIAKRKTTEAVREASFEIMVGDDICKTWRNQTSFSVSRGSVAS